MSINTIQLKTSMLADLYRNSLVESTTSMPESKQLNYLGNNKQNILIFVLHENLAFLPDKELEFLTNVLSACKLSIADIGIINAHNAEQDEIQNIINSEATNILLFGVEPLSIGLPINFPFYQLQKFAGKTYLAAPGLNYLQEDKTAKQKLWTCLKSLFQL